MLEQGDDMSTTDDKTPECADQENAAGSYWRENIRLLGILMSIWFVCSFGAGILFRDFLDQFHIGGYPLGFWFAQQGSIYIFIALIFVYSWKIHRIEQQYQFDDDDDGKEQG